MPTCGRGSVSTSSKRIKPIFSVYLPSNRQATESSPIEAVPVTAKKTTCYPSTALLQSPYSPYSLYGHPLRCPRRIRVAAQPETQARFHLASIASIHGMLRLLRPCQGFHARYDVEQF